MKDYLIAALIGYLLGCSNMAYYISRIKHFDVRTSGTKNLGASNVTYLLGKKAGLITCIHDILKATIAVYITLYLFPNTHAFILSGASAIIGHMFPFYLKFKGGKGFASYLGAMLAIDWKYFIILIVAIAIVVLISDYIVAGTVLTSLLSPIYACIKFGYIPMLFLIIPSIIIILKHRENYRHIKSGEEFKVRTTLLHR